MKTTIYLLIVVVFFVFNTTFAQDGTIDPSWDGAGIIFPNYGTLGSDNLYLKVQPDGKVVSIETVSDHGVNPQYYLKRYNSSGYYDTGFGVGGSVMSNFPGLTAKINGIELQSDGKILTAGFLTGAGGGAFVARYNVDGVLDSSFGVSGLLIIAADYLQSFALQSDGKILVAYGLYTGVRKLARYSSTGILDASFGIGGSINVTSQGKLRVQTDGKILFSSGDNDFILTRYLNNGTIDTAFGIYGTVAINIDDSDIITSVKSQSDGSILFVGKSTNLATFTDSYKLFRLLSNGILDPSFGTEGMVSLMMVSAEMEFQFDGKIIVAGSLPMADGPNQLALSRYLANGDLDMSFGTNGFSTASLGESVRVFPSAVEFSADGKILVGGTFSEAFLSGHSNSFMARFNTFPLATPDFAANKNTFGAYPNPVNQIVNIDFNLTQSEVLSIDLFDINGRKISNLLNNGNFQSGYNSQKLELPESLSHGIYFLNISNGKNTSTVKIVK